MMKFARYAFLLGLVGCGEANMNREKPTIRFEIDTPIDKALSSSSVDFKKNCMQGLCLYKFSLSFANTLRADVSINSNNGNLKFDDVVSTTLGTFENNTINNARVTLGGVPQDSKHDQAMRYFYQQIGKLQTAGWKRYIFQNEARVSSEEARKFESTRSIFGKPVGTGPWKDPALKLSAEEWLALPTINSWYFYRNGVYLLLRVQRENDTQAPQKQGSYLFTLSFESESEFYKGFVEGEKNRENWKAHVPAELKRMAQERAQTEARLKQMGIAIDEDYQDPPIKALE
ncbi:hypothetical protein [Pseudomonas faucium]|uniref:hypothetical protein n=1 Tax=Pseudomonas faucium TaxID=2740518 RepID=UPI00159708CB|nr:hypothetical protein [Pseudomonas faucium]